MAISEITITLFAGKASPTLTEMIVCEGGAECGYRVLNRLSGRDVAAQLNVHLVELLTFLTACAGRDWDMSINEGLVRSGQFRDRREAGQRLAAKLTTYANRPEVLVLALPRGGLPVAYEVASALGAPLDVFVVRKLGVSRPRGAGDGCDCHRWHARAQ